MGIEYVGVPMMTLMPALPMASTTRSIQAYWKLPSSGSQRLQVDSPMRTTVMSGGLHQRDILVEAFVGYVLVVVGGAVEDVGHAVRAQPEGWPAPSVAR